MTYPIAKHAAKLYLYTDWQHDTAVWAPDARTAASHWPHNPHLPQKPFVRVAFETEDVPEGYCPVDKDCLASGGIERVRTAVQEFLRAL